MRKLDCEQKTLSQKLRALRCGKAVSLDTLERVTHIRRSYLEALEKGNYDELPEPLYARNFIRAYTAALSADETYFLELYDEECGLCDLVEPMSSPRQRVRKKKFYIWSRFVKFALLGCLLLSVLGYISYQVISLIRPPQIVLLSPTEDVLTDSAKMSIKGIVESETSVYVNEVPVVVNDDLTFDTVIDLELGLNTLTVEAERRYSKTALIERSIVFEPERGISEIGFLIW